MAFIEASYRLPSPSGLVILLEISTQNSMLVSTLLVRGALSCWGPARRTMTVARTSAGTDSASASAIAQPRLAGCPPWSNGKAIRPPERFQTHARSETGIPSKASTAG